MKTSKNLYAVLISVVLLSFIMIAEQASAEKIKPYDWSQTLEIPPGTGIDEGNQILHFKSKNRHYTKNSSAKKFVENYFINAKVLQSDAEVLRFASDAVVVQNGVFLEMGVCTGRTINFIAALNPSKVIYGFDSFNGLPEEWVRYDRVFKKGTFGFKDDTYTPPVLHNVRLYKGWFKEVLPGFKSEVLKNTPIAFLHIDCDIYSSTKDVLNILKTNFMQGTIIVFDELYNYPGFEEHEWKALQEFLNETKFEMEILAFNENHEQVVIKLIKK